MKIFLPEPEIGELDGFTEENDLFGRKLIGDGLSHLVANSDAPLVLAIDAQWGAGKTVFLKQWAGELRKAGYPVVFFDAFQHDYAEDAFAAMASQIVRLVEDRKKAKTSAGKKILAGAIDVTKVVTRSALRTGIKIASLNVVDTKDLEEAAKTIGDELSHLEDRYLGEMLTKQKNSASTIERFREALSELPEALGATKPNGGGSLPLVFIIDELDRCRPVFALEVLERIKHFFSVNNVHFVLGVHLAQLRNSIIATYGANIDAGVYLQKFIHLVVHLSETGTYEHERSRAKFIDHLITHLSFKRAHRDAFAILRHVAESRDLSLRTIERIVSNLALAYAYLPENRYAPPSLIAGLCILKVVEPALYGKALRGTLTYVEVAKILGFDITTSNENNNMTWNARYWAFFTGETLDDPDRQGIMRELDRFTFSSTTNVLPWIANNITERLHPF